MSAEPEVELSSLQLDTEAALCALPSVSAAAVAVVRRGTQAMVAACVVPVAGASALTTRRVQMELADAGRDASAPDRIVPVPALPMLPDGAIDRAGVAAFLATRLEHEEHRLVEPRDGVESALREIWVDALGHRQLGVTDDFFALGGHSLLAGRVIVEIERRLDVVITPAMFGAAPTIEQLAAVVRGDGDDIRSDHARRRLSRTGVAPLFLAYSLRGTAMQYRPLTGVLAYPTHALEAPWWDGHPPSERRLEDLAVGHAQEIRAIQPNGPYRLGGFSFGGTLAWAIADVLEAHGETVEPLIMLDAQVIRGRRPPSFPRHAVPGPPPGSGRWAATAAFARMSRRAPVRATVENGAVLLGLADSLDAALAAWDLRRRGSVRASRRAQFVWRVLAQMGLRYAPAARDRRIVLLRASRNEPDPRSQGWEDLARAGVDTCDIDAEHDELLVEPAVDLVALAIDRALGQPSARV